MTHPNLFDVQWPLSLTLGVKKAWSQQNWSIGALRENKSTLMFY